MRRAGKFAGLFAGPFGRMRRETDCSGLLRAAWAGRPDSARVGLL